MFSGVPPQMLSSLYLSSDGRMLCHIYLFEDLVAKRRGGGAIAVTKKQLYTKRIAYVY